MVSWISCLSLPLSPFNEPSFLPTFIINRTPIVSSSIQLVGLFSSLRRERDKVQIHWFWIINKEKLEAVKKQTVSTPQKKELGPPFCCFFCSQQLAQRQSNKWKTWGQIRPSLAWGFYLNQETGLVSWCCNPRCIELEVIAHSWCIILFDWEVN